MKREKHVREKEDDEEETGRSERREAERRINGNATWKEQKIINDGYATIVMASVMK